MHISKGLPGLFLKSEFWESASKSWIRHLVIASYKSIQSNLINSKSLGLDLTWSWVYFSTAAGVPGTGVGSRWLECLTPNPHASPFSGSMLPRLHIFMSGTRDLFWVFSSSNYREADIKVLNPPQKWLFSFFSLSKIMFYVHKRNISGRCFFYASKTYFFYRLLLE